MNNKRCNQRILSVSSERRNKRKLSRDVEGLFNAAVPEQTLLPDRPACDIEELRNKRKLSRDVEGVIDATVQEQMLRPACDFEDLRNKRKLSRDVEGVIDAEVQEQMLLPSRPACNLEITRKLLESLAQDYTKLGEHLRGVIAAEQLKIAANEKDLDELKNLYNAMKMKEAENKRRRWCNWCEEEASFLKGQFFYCSALCEEQHLDSLVKFS